MAEMNDKEEFIFKTYDEVNREIVRESFSSLFFNAGILIIVFIACMLLSQEQNACIFIGILIGFSIVTFFDKLKSYRNARRALKLMVK